MTDPPITIEALQAQLIELKEQITSANTERDALKQKFEDVDNSLEDARKLNTKLMMGSSIPEVTNNDNDDGESTFEDVIKDMITSVNGDLLANMKKLKE